tara:strand:- start:238 stop:720 length:483 start_codon:yes stop_codon:yes gene_type:complete
MENKMKPNNELINALIKAFTNMNNASKDKTNPFHGNSYATLESSLEAVKQPLLDEGVMFLQRFEENDRGVCVETIFYGHGSELSSGKMFVPADKNNAQGFGSAMTYARRYSLVTACGIGAGIKVEENATVEKTGVDDDGNSASAVVKQKPKVVKKTDPFE